MQLRKELTNHATSAKAVADTRLKLLRAVASAEWCPEREKLRVFSPALVKANICRVIDSRWFDAFLSDLTRLERVQAQAAHIVVGVSKAVNREGVLREARLKLINEVALRRALEYYLLLMPAGPQRAKVADSTFPPEPRQSCEGTAPEQRH
ncbi:hypothetical protein ERJ75_000101100 [Trypanosoma vivax]|nr:hypothetical protein ERJ75_000101100 [Trypanosoma vivax]